MIWKLDSECWWADQLTANDQLGGAKAIIAVADNLDIDPNRYAVPFFRIPIEDNADINPSTIALIFQAMKSCHECNHLPFIVMCRAGMSRSASFAALWLTWRHGFSYQEAMRKVKSIRTDTFPWEHTWRQLENWSIQNVISGR